LLWVDGIGGAVAGVVVLLAYGWLSAWYNLPRELLFGIGVANLSYGAYSLTLASRKRRPKPLILFLIAANLTWAGLCFWWAVRFAESASWLGLTHLVAEGLYVGGLAILEWRSRDLLLAA